MSSFSSSGVGHSGQWGSDTTNTSTQLEGESHHTDVFADSSTVSSQPERTKYGYRSLRHG